MPFYVKFIRWYYIFLTVLVFIAPLDYPLYKYIPALVIMWVSYLFFNFGSKNHAKYSQNRELDRKIPRSLNKELLFFVCFMVVFIPLYIRFYTGGNILTLVRSFGSGIGTDSNYALYQQYFEENSLNQFSIQKLPYILGYGIAKFLFYYFVISYVGFTKKLEKQSLILIVLLFALFSLVGMSRGTSFENFESLVLLIFSLLVRSKIIYNKNTFTKSQIIAVSVVVVILGGYFIISKALRSSGEAFSKLSGPSSTLRYNPDHWIMHLSPNVGKVALNFTGYFTFPIYFTSELFWKIWSESLSGMMAAFLPGVASWVLNLTDYRKALENLGVDTGACWNPDCTTAIFYLGVPLFFLLSYYLGKYSSKFYDKSVVNRDVGYTLFLYIIVYEMISFPVGNFLVISSANKIVLLCVFVVVYFGLFKKYRLR